MGARMVAEMEGKSNPTGTDSLFLTLGTVGLLSRFLLVVLVGLVASGSGQWALQDLEDLLILDLLVRLELGQIGGGGRCQTGDTVLCDGCPKLVFGFNESKGKIKTIPRVVSRRETGALSASPAGSYCRKTPPRTHSTTPTLADFSSSSWRKLKGN